MPRRNKSNSPNTTRKLPKWSDSMLVSGRTTKADTSITNENNLNSSKGRSNDAVMTESFGCQLTTFASSTCTLGVNLGGHATAQRELQSRLLFLALLENYCNFYGKDAAQLFVLLCAHLIKTGILKEDDLDGQLMSIREVYRQAFHHLVHQTLDLIAPVQDAFPLASLSPGFHLPNKPIGPTLADKLHQQSNIEDSFHANDAPFNPIYPRIMGYPISSQSAISARIQETTSRTLPTHEMLEQNFKTVHKWADSPTNWWPFSEHYYGTLSPPTIAPVASPSSLMVPSRFQQDFVIGNRLGHGAFGSVYVGTNKLDGREYAIKRIKFNTIGPATYRKILREVYSLARLDHQNVVRYHSAWLECLPPSSHQSSQSSQGTQDELEGWEEDDDEDASVDGTDASLLLLRNQMALYIQMQLCHFTLRDWIQIRNEMHFNPNYSPQVPLHPLLKQLVHLGDEGLLFVFKQIVQGLVYMHSHGYIHRDLKPQNIFFYIPEGAVGVEEVQVKIGDFSLVSIVPDMIDPNCSMFENGIPTSTSPITTGQLYGEEEPETSGVGTCTYASPEQLAPRPNPTGSCDYSQKADIYSLGIIFFELFLPFYSQCERFRVIEQLRINQLLPESFVPGRPAESAFILWCTSLEPSDRPSAQEINRLDFLAHLRHSNNNSIATFLTNSQGCFMTESSSLMLKRQLEEKEQEISQLRSHIRLLESKIGCK